MLRGGFDPSRNFLTDQSIAALHKEQTCLPLSLTGNEISGIRGWGWFGSGIYRRRRSGTRRSTGCGSWSLRPGDGNKTQPDACLGGGGIVAQEEKIRRFIGIREAIKVSEIAYRAGEYHLIV